MGLLGTCSCRQGKQAWGRGKCRGCAVTASCLLELASHASCWARVLEGIVACGRSTCHPTLATAATQHACMPSCATTHAFAMLSFQSLCLRASASQPAGGEADGEVILSTSRRARVPCRDSSRTQPGYGDDTCGADKELDHSASKPDSSLLFCCLKQ